MPTAMVLAAGLGTRLRPLTEELPKPLLPLGDRPVLAHVLERLERTGVGRVAINAHHLAPKMRGFADAYPSIGHVSHEPEIRGTAGGVAGARAWLGQGPILVSNADLILDVPARELLGAVSEGGLCFAVALRRAGEGRVGLSESHELVRLRDERFAEERYGADYLSVAGLGADVLSALPERGCLVGDVALPMLRQGRKLKSVVVTTPFWSLGDSIPDYLDANLRWLAESGLASFVGEGARVESAVELQESVIGAGAEVSGSGALVRSVIWPGARARAPLVDTVVTSSGVLVSRDGRVA